MDDFATLEVRILPLEDAGYPVELELNQARQLGRGVLDPAQLPDLQGFPSDVAGTTLYNWLTSDLRIRSAVMILPPHVNRAALAKHMRESFLRVTLDLNQGHGRAVGWGTDLSYEYVRINAEYTT